MPILRVLFVVLLLVNLFLFFLGQGYLGRGQEGEEERLAKQLAPEKLHLVKEDKAAPAAVPPAVTDTVASAQAPAAPAPQPPAESKPAAAAAPVAAKVEEKPKPACRMVPTLSAEQAAKALGLLKNLATVQSVVKELPASPTTYWVHLPPLPDKAAAEARVVELKEKGLKDLYIVQDEGPQRYAVSLGLFRLGRGANEYLAKMKNMGLAQASITPRGGESHRNLILNGPADAVSEALAKLNAGLGELRVTTCGR